MDKEAKLILLLILIAAVRLWGQKRCELYLVPSTVPGAGRGIIAGVDYKQGDAIEAAPTVLIDTVTSRASQLDSYVFTSAISNYTAVILGSISINNHHQRYTTDHQWGQRNTEDVISMYRPYAKYNTVLSIARFNHDIGDEFFGFYGEQWFDRFKSSASGCTSTAEGVTSTIPAIVETPMEPKRVSIDDLEAYGHCLSDTNMKRALRTWSPIAIEPPPTSGTVSTTAAKRGRGGGTGTGAGAGAGAGAGVHVGEYEYEYEYGLYARRYFRSGEVVTVSPVLALSKSLVDASASRGVLMNYCFASTDRFHVADQSNSSTSTPPISKIVFFPFAYASVINHAKSDRRRTSMSSSSSTNNTHKSHRSATAAAIGMKTVATANVRVEWYDWRNAAEFIANKYHQSHECHDGEVSGCGGDNGADAGSHKSHNNNNQNAAMPTLQEMLRRSVQELIESPSAPLDIAYIATRPIRAGEEILLDYGEAWEKAWAEYVTQWKAWETTADSSASTGSEEKEQNRKTTVDTTIQVLQPTSNTGRAVSHSFKQQPVFRSYIGAPEGLYQPHWLEESSSSSPQDRIYRANSKVISNPAGAGAGAGAGSGARPEEQVLDVRNNPTSPNNSDSNFHGGRDESLNESRSARSESTRNKSPEYDDIFSEYDEDRLCVGGCGLWLVPSMEVQGRGVVSGCVFPNGSIVVPLMTAVLVHEETKRQCQIREYAFGTGHEDYNMLMLGPGSLFNHHPTQSNLDHFSPDSLQIPNLKDENLGYSNYARSFFRLNQAVEPGQELFEYYGDNWFTERFDKGSTASSSVTSDPDGSSAIVYDALADNTNSDDVVTDKTHKSDTHKVAIDPKDLLQHGHCLTDVAVKPSGIDSAGMGLFARKRFNVGEIVTISPVLSLSKAVADASINTSVLVNYCIASSSQIDSDLVFFPLLYGGIINHAPTSSSSELHDDPKFRANVHMKWFDWQNPAQTLAAKYKPQDPRYASLAGSIYDQSVEYLIRAPFAQLDIAYVATRTIAADEEIFLDYGEEWLSSWLEFQRQMDKWHGLNDSLNGQISVDSKPIFRQYISATDYLYPRHWTK